MVKFFTNYLYAGYGYGLGYLLENALYLSLRRVGYQIYVETIKDIEYRSYTSGRGAERLTEE
ncbi:MAG TPA: hypothetical protein DCZ19_09400 [Porphyromonadaceae bacterium]|nr:MAG: hypothetical protein A2W87_02725 [Bacteroidetes bacterium GWC2_46_850]HBB01266.1 hypothetical protein [Porphyromonadaceae bacterium]